MSVTAMTDERCELLLSCLILKTCQSNIGTCTKSLDQPANVLVGKCTLPDLLDGFAGCFRVLLALEAHHSPPSGTTIAAQGSLVGEKYRDWTPAPQMR